ncbi:MAG: hypothetical protein KDK70_31305, partial [Myxococcales bacterium]|nr:hypothetical protein [Myxococcales bacterium]
MSERRMMMLMMSSGSAAAMMWLLGCADPCVDDGLAQDPVCASNGGTSGASTSSDEAPPGTSADASSTDSMPGGDGSSGDGDATTGCEQSWCLDADGDGFGDPSDCICSEGPVPGRVDNDDDCDDDSGTTFPGAAELELDMPNACRRDDDDDGWGDADPPGGGGVVSGSDCHDDNGALSPSTLALTAFLPYKQWSGDRPRTLAPIDVPLAPTPPFVPMEIDLEPMVTFSDGEGGIPAVDIVTSTMDGSGRIVASDAFSDRLHEVDYDVAACAEGGTISAFGEPYGDGQAQGDLVCGVEFGPGGNLYGINLLRQLLTIDPVDGHVIDTRSLSDIEIGWCGMAYDCREDR